MKATTETWQKNLYAIVIAEFVVIVGFYSVNPFLPLFIRELGDFTESEAAFWAGLATGSAGLAAFIAMPIWGLMADRFGRKPMVLRSMFAGAAVMTLVGLSPNVQYLVGLRFLQGIATGTIGAASAMVASQTPRDKIPFAMGLLMLSVYAGTTIGPLLGGAIADSLGFRPAFFITGGLIFLGGLVVLFFTKENFEKAKEKPAASLKAMLKVATSREIATLLAVLCALQAGTQVLGPVIPLFVQRLGTGSQAATVSGLTFGFMGALGAISAVIAGRLATRFPLTRILLVCCLGTAVLYLLPLLANSVTQLVVFTALTALLVGGMMTSASALVGMSVKRQSQGVAYGIAQSAQALGGGLGPILGGMVAAWLGFKSIFPIASVIFLAVGILVARLPESRTHERPGL